MNVKRICHAMLLLLCLLSVGVTGQAQTPGDRTEVEAFLKQEIHDAAVQVLQAPVEQAGGQVLLTVGLTGTVRDTPLLRRYLSTDNKFLRVQVVAALARLGDKVALDEIAAVLEKPVRTKPAEVYSRDTGKPLQPMPGALVTVFEDADRFREAAFEAGFSMNRRFIPFLARHLDDPPGQFHGDYSDPSPAREAEGALSQIVDGKEYILRDWKAWRQEQKSALKDS